MHLPCITTQLKDDELVVASALGLGQTAIVSKEMQRLCILIKLKQPKKEFKSLYLKRLAQAYSKQAQPGSKQVIAEILVVYSLERRNE